MLRPAIRAAKALRGRVRTSAAGPCSTIRPPSSTTTVSASSRASRTSWVTRMTLRSASTLRKRLAQCRGDGDVERGHRLVEEQQAWVGGQGAGDGDALGLPAGELGGLAVGELRDADLLQPVSCGRVRLASGRRRGLRGANATLSSTVRCGNSSGSWASSAICAVVRRAPRPAWPRLADDGEQPTVERRSRPWSGRSSPAATASTVDLPAPFGPEQRDRLTGGDREGDVDVRARRTVAENSNVTGPSVPAGRTR